jgi:hypothetical protein
VRIFTLPLAVGCEKGHTHFGAWLYGEADEAVVVVLGAGAAAAGAGAVDEVVDEAAGVVVAGAGADELVVEVEVEVELELVVVAVAVAGLVAVVELSAVPAEGWLAREAADGARADPWTGTVPAPAGRVVIDVAGG